MTDWNEQLFIATRHNNVSLVRDAMAQGASPNINEAESGDTPLIVAIKSEHMAIADILLEAGADPNVFGAGKRTALHDAAARGQGELVQKLLDKGADVDVRDSGGRSPLTQATAANYSEIATVLMDAGASVDAVGAEGNTALHWAIKNDNTELALAIIQKGANPNSANDKKQTPLHVAASKGMDGVVKALLDADAELELKGINGWTPLLAAGFDGHLSTMQLLLDAGADIQAVSEKANTALMTAIDKKLPDQLRLLLDHGADPDHGNRKTGRVPLIHVVREGMSDMVDILLEAGAGVNLKTGDMSALTHAVLEKKDAITEKLLAAGADPNAQATKAAYPIQLAAERGNMDLTRRLIAAGANLDVQTEKAASPLHLAVASGKEDMAKLLLVAGADPSFGNSLNLHMAALNNNLGIAKALLAKGASLDVKNTQGKTPFDIAKKGKNREMMGLLKAAQRGKRPTELEAGLEGLAIEMPAPKRDPLDQIFDQQVSHMLPANEDEALAEPKQVVGEHTRRVLAANSGPRAEYNALEDLAEQVIGDKFIAELAYRNGFGEEEYGALEGAKVNIERRYRSGPEPKWRVELSVGPNHGDLHDVLGDMVEELQAQQLDVKLEPRGRGKAIVVDYHASIDTVLEAFNTTLSDAIGKIDASELRAAAKANAQHQSKQQDLAR